MYRRKGDLGYDSRMIRLLLLCALLTGCSKQYDGYAYPDRNDLSKVHYTGTFDSEFECLDASEAWLIDQGISGGDYECAER